MAFTPTYIVYTINALSVPETTNKMFTLVSTGNNEGRRRQLRPSSDATRLAVPRRNKLGTFRSICAGPGFGIDSGEYQGGVICLCLQAPAEN